MWRRTAIPPVPPNSTGRVDHAPYPAAMAYFPGPPPPPMRRSNTTWTVLIVVGVVLAVCSVCGIVTGVFIYHSVRSAVSSVAAVDSAVDSYLTHLEQDQTDAAYDQLCTAMRRITTREDFTRKITTHVKPARHSITGTRVSNVNGSVSADVHAQVWYVDDTTGSVGFILAKEGDWKICS
jgi:hypothetical protein